MTRFTLRDVFWLTLVVGIALGWWAEHRRLKGVQANYESAAELLEQEGYVRKSNGRFRTP